MLKLFLIRHGIAADRTGYIHDAERPLTTNGKIRTHQVATRLRDLEIQFDLILTSPLLRARQTADILVDAGCVAKTMAGEPYSYFLQRFSALAPGGAIEHWFEWLERWQPDLPQASLALVGHQPDLGHWAEMLLWNAIGDRLILKKAGIIGIEIANPAQPLQQSRLFLLTSPKWLL